MKKINKPKIIAGVKLTFADGTSKTISIDEMLLITPDFICKPITGIEFTHIPIKGVNLC